MTVRYARQIPIIGEEGQSHLKNASILVIGAGGVGSPVLMYLAGAGIGTLGIIDFDTVDLSNLQRQILFSENDIGSNKAEQGTKKLKAFNSEIKINAYSEKLTLNNANDILSGYDLIIDGSDNFQTRYLVNDICCQLNLPLISVSIYQSQIQLVVINPSQGCYRCVFPDPPPPHLIQNCSLSGIIGANAGVAGSITASIAIKMIVSKTSEFFNKIIKINCDHYSMDRLEFEKVSDCNACSKRVISWPVLTYSIELEQIELSDYLIVDLREVSEDRTEMLTSKQQHIPFTEFIKNPTQLPRVKLLFYCSKGFRSEYAAYLLRGKGYDAYSLKST